MVLTFNSFVYVLQWDTLKLTTFNGYKTAVEVIPLAVQITAHHLGYFEFRLCKYEGGLEDEQCFLSDDSLIKFVDGSTRYYITSLGSLFYRTLASFTRIKFQKSQF